MSQDSAEPAIVVRRAQPYIGIRREVPDGVPAMMDAAFPELFGWIGRNGVEVAGPIIVRCWEVDEEGEPLVMEAAAPVAERPALEGEIRADELPAGRWLVVTHAGPYRSETHVDMADTRSALLAFAEAEGLSLTRPTDRGRAPLCAADHMLLGPAETSDFSDWRTEIAYLLEGD